MKVVALLGATLLATPALAQDETVEIEIDEVVADGEGHQVQFFGFHEMAGTREEAAANAEARFAERDKDGNGVLEGDELHRFQFRMPAGAMMLREKGAAMHPMPPMPPMPRMAMRMSMEPGKMFDEIDTDGNGSISREEFEAHHENHGAGEGHHVMRRMELPEGEGHVTINRWTQDEKDGEHREVIVRRIGDGGSWTSEDGRTVAIERIEKLLGGREDADSDGKITREEAVASALARFDAMDKDGDGTLSDEERPHIVRRVVEIKE